MSRYYYPTLPSKIPTDMSAVSLSGITPVVVKSHLLKVLRPLQTFQIIYRMRKHTLVMKYLLS